MNQAEIIGFLIARITILQIETSVKSERRGLTQEELKELSNNLKALLSKTESLWRSRVEG